MARLRSLGHALLNFGPLESVARQAGLLASSGTLVRVAGARHRVEQGPLVVASSHLLGFDLTLLVAAYRRRLELVLAGYLLELPLLRPSLRARGAYAVTATAVGWSDENVASLDRAAEAVRGGAAVLVFPEGTGRSVGGGAIRVAARAGAPVQPVLLYGLLGFRARPRLLARVHRALPPPPDDAAARRRRRSSLARRFRALGALRAVAGADELLAVQLDDAEVWRHPSRVVRLCGRVSRLDAASLRRQARWARAMLRACDRLNCSVGDLRAPPGLRHVAGYVALLPVTLVGALLCGPFLLVLRAAACRVRHPGDRRAVRRVGGMALALPWGVLLAAGGSLALGPWGLLLPFAALGGGIALGLARELRRRVVALVPVARHGARLMRLLAAAPAAASREKSARGGARVPQARPNGSAEGVAR
ncbi:MAG: 1-acyl-sn-glycerol-3-phosphate acyltransferase [Planctomycetaceae bacterium]